MESNIAGSGSWNRPRNDSFSLSSFRQSEAEQLASDADPWGWVDQEYEEVRQDVSSLKVTAVLVAFDAARWLPDTLAGLDRLEHRPSRLIAIDNGSSDATRALLDQAVDHGILDAVYSGKRSFGFGAGVKSALRQDRARRAGDTETTQVRPTANDDSHWLWLLHDDASPAPDALYRLLAHVAGDPTIDITGPKLLLPRRRQAGQQISEVGVSISGSGRRDLALDPGELDQGQRDQPQARLGVSTCGMLVRMSVWNDLDGLDPAIPVFRDGVEFGWRAHLNGYRVVTTPSAMLTHRQVGRAGLRPRGLTGRRPGQVDRQLGMIVVAGHAPGKMLPLVWLRLVASCLALAVGYLIGKVPGRALDEILALRWFCAHPGQVRDLRTRTASIDPAPGTGEVVQALRPPWWSSLRVGAEVLSGAASDRYRSVAGDAEAASLDELTGDDFSSLAEERPRSLLLSPIVLTTVVAVVASVIAARSLIGLGALAGPALLPAPDRLGELWDAAIQPIVGAPSQISPPWLALAALGATLLAGQPEWFNTLLICGVVPLALLAAYPVVRRVINERRLRLWVAATYALLPVLLGGSNQGRLSLSIVAIGLPLLIQATRALVLRRVDTPEAWRGGWGAGVVLVALIAFEPSLIVPAVLIGACGVVMLRRTPRKIGRIGIALGLPLLVLLPWWPSIIAEPGRLFVGPDAALGGAPAAPAVAGLLLGRGLGPGLPPFWLGAVIFGTIWVLALIGLARRPDRRAVMAAWITALVAVGMAVGLSRLVVSIPPVGTEVRPWVGTYLLIGFGALTIGAGIGIDGLLAELGERSFSWLQPISVLAAVAVAAVSLAGAAWWVVAGVQGPIVRTRFDAIPPYVMNGMQTPNHPRLLALDLSDGPARYSVLSDDYPRLGAADRGYTFGGSVDAREQVDDLVVRLVAGTADSDIAPQLADLGIGYLWVTGAGEDVISRIDNTPGLGTASGNEQGTVWQLEPPVARTVLVDDAARVPIAGPPVTVPPGPDGRTLRIGEAADRRWRAEVDGRDLPAVTAGWQQAFAVGSAGGSLRWSLPSAHGWVLGGQGLVLLVAAVLAAPAIRRPEVRDPTKSARRSATLSELV
jgi:GT2 family glycosyltransferase